MFMYLPNLLDGFFRNVCVCVYIYIYIYIYVYICVYIVSIYIRGGGEISPFQQHVLF